MADITEDFCDVGDTVSYSCIHCHPNGLPTPSIEERTVALLKRIERGEARTTITPTKTTPMDFAAWAESVTTRTTHDGDQRGNL